MRFVWDASEVYLKEKMGNKKIGFFARILLNYIRIWDKAAADRPDYLLSNSLYTQKRIQKYYGRESTVIYPPVIMENTEQENSKSENTNYKRQTANYFLVVSRLSAYKKIDKVIEAFNKLELPLIIVGEGEEEKNLKAIAEKNISFLGFQPEAELQKIYAKVRAFVFAAEEDFGMAAVEAMQQGVPVLTLRKGGALETVIEGKTGEFFEAVSPEVIADTVRKFVENEEKYNKEIIQKRAGEFSKERFMRELREYINKI
jgi:glycosyltransferase involved in cell wall biosynthesis